MTTIDPSRVLALRAAILEQNSALQRAAASGNAAAATGTAQAGAPSQPVNFGDTLRGALSQVNGLDAQASQMSEAYERGQTTDVAAVMLARQRASLGFEATLQVRNRLLSAYKDIMNMPV